MNARRTVAAAVLLVLALLLGTQFAPDPRSATRTTWGTGGGGFGAFYDLLVELDVPVARSFERVDRLPADATVWWLAPGRACGLLGTAAAAQDDAGTRAAGSGVAGSAAASRAGGADSAGRAADGGNAAGGLAGASDDPWREVFPIDDWIRGGGTAVWLLPSAPQPCLRRAALAGARLPTRWSERADPADEGAVAVDDDEAAADGGGEASAGRQLVERWLGDFGQGRSADMREQLVRAVASDEIAGARGAEQADGVEQVDPARHAAPAESGREAPLVPRPRRLIDHPLDHFLNAHPAPGAAARVDAPGWRVRATLDGQPFVVERRLGRGRAVVVADAHFLRNRTIDLGDAALFGLDLAEAYGAPLFDERSHGMRGLPALVPYVARSPAAPLLAGTALLFLWVVWALRALPEAAPGEGVPPVAAPTLEAYVASIAALYARSGDLARVLQRYREVALERLRVALALPAETPRAALIERLRNHPRVDREAIRLLVEDDAEPSEALVRGRARELDALVKGVTQ